MTNAASKAFDDVVGKLTTMVVWVKLSTPMDRGKSMVVKSPEGQNFVGMMWAARTTWGV